jgi:hypothetical protein
MTSYVQNLVHILQSATLFVGNYLLSLMNKLDHANTSVASLQHCERVQRERGNFSR